MIEITGENLLSLQQVLLMIMDDIDHVCRQHNLKYNVRHELHFEQLGIVDSYHGMMILIINMPRK